MPPTATDEVSSMAQGFIGVPFEYDRSFYLTSVQYPYQLAQTTNDPGSMRGVRVQSVGICPFAVRNRPE